MRLDQTPDHQQLLTLPKGLKSLVRRIMDDATTRRMVVLIDGGSGAGKTTLADELTTSLTDHGIAHIQKIGMDSFYPGWDGLRAASTMLPELLTRSNPGFWRWDWRNNCRANWVPIDPCAPIILEGCGALTRSSAPLASTSAWFSLASKTRKRRALARDGESYSPHWNRWAAQERTHWQDDRPRRLADVILSWAQAALAEQEHSQPHKITS